jgi:uncharacterized Zn finger protein (UPF0148 family)
VGFFDPDRLFPPMSGFDEEAERERLREKYEQDQEKRASTQRMSELLLKGATMTNSHCDTCGDPIFRHDGQEFCPTCQAAAQEGAAGGTTDASDDGTADASAETDAAPETSPAADEAESEGPADASADVAPGPEPSARDRRTPSDAGADTPTNVRDDRSRGSVAGSAVTRRPSTGDAPLGEARASLSRTLRKYARAAEETDDPRRAKDFLAAAREAAETLSALER